MAYLVIFVCLLAAVWLGWLLRAWWAPEATPPTTKGRACDVCGRALGDRALRTHDGQWRCQAHKGLP